MNRSHSTLKPETGRNNMGYTDHELQRAGGRERRKEMEGDRV